VRPAASVEGGGATPRRRRALRVIPGDPEKAFSPRGRSADPERLRQIREDLGLGLPWHEQFWAYLKSLARFDLATSRFATISGSRCSS
jgi:ABC-type dipeptide/oligopeptide/nickel transport system permease component